MTATLPQHEDDAGAYLPTPEEIEAATAAIRESWDEREYHRRAGIQRSKADVTEAKVVL